MDGISYPTLLVDIECFISHPTSLYSLLYRFFIYVRIYSVANWFLRPDPNMELWLVAHEKTHNVYLYSENSKEWPVQKIAAEEVGRSITKYTRGSLLQQMNFKGVESVISPTPLPGDKAVAFSKT